MIERANHIDAFKAHEVTHAPPGFEFFPYSTVSLVIPTKNEAKNLPHVLPRIPAIVDEVILVDANSTDGTVEVARSLYPDIQVITQPGRGKGNALRAGFEAAHGDIIVMIDADGSMAPEEIPAFVNALLDGADFAKGSRFLKGKEAGTDDMEFHRYLGNLGFTVLVRLLYGGRYTDLCYGYCAFWRHVLPSLQLTSDGFEIETEMNVRALKAGLHIAEVSSFEYERIHGVSNLNAVTDGLRVLRVILQEYFPRLQPAADGAALTKDEFTAAMSLLFKEANHLARRRVSLSQHEYQVAVEAIKSASRTLLTMESRNPIMRRQQEIFQRQGDKLWSFLDLAN